MDMVPIDCHLMRVNVVKFHLTVASFAACDITSVIHSELVYSIINVFKLIFIRCATKTYALSNRDLSLHQNA